MSMECGSEKSFMAFLFISLDKPFARRYSDDKPSVVVEGVFVGGVQHRDNVLRRDVSHDIVYLVKDEASVGLENAHQVRDVLTYLVRGTAAENVLSFAAAAPEGDFIAKFTLELFRLHAACGDLHRVDDIHAAVHDHWQGAGDGSAAMHENFNVACFMDMAAEFAQEGRANLQKIIRAAQQVVLRAEIGVDFDAVNITSHGAVHAVKVGNLTLELPFVVLYTILGIGDHVAREVKTVEKGAVAHVHGKEIGFLAQLARAAGKKGKPFLGRQTIEIRPASFKEEAAGQKGHARSVAVNRPFSVRVKHWIYRVRNIKHIFSARIPPLGGRPPGIEQDGINMKALADVRVHTREKLRHINHFNVIRAKPEIFAQVVIGKAGNTC